MPENVSVRPLSPSPPTHEARIGHVRSVLITATQKASLNPSLGAPRKPVGSPKPRKNPLSREARFALAGNDPSRKKSMTARADGSIGFRRPAASESGEPISIGSYSGRQKLAALRSTPDC